jgi:hypothetical protein
MRAVDSNKVEQLARKLFAEADPANRDLEGARSAARAMLEESEERVFDPAAHDHEADGIIRRSSTETAATGDSGVIRWVSDGG